MDSLVLPSEEYSLEPASYLVNNELSFQNQIILCLQSHSIKYEAIYIYSTWLV